MILSVLFDFRRVFIVIMILSVCLDFWCVFMVIKIPLVLFEKTACDASNHIIWPVVVSVLQLLALTIQNEKPELEVRKTDLLKQEEDLKIQLAKLEESLLEVLHTHKSCIHSQNVITPTNDVCINMFAGITNHMAGAHAHGDRPQSRCKA